MDDESDRITISAEYSTDNGVTFLPATEAIGVGSQGSSDLESSPSGVLHIFAWNAVLDLSQLPATGLILKIQAFDAAPGGEDQSRPFTVLQYLVAMINRPIPFPGNGVPVNQAELNALFSVGNQIGGQVRCPVVIGSSESGAMDVEVDYQYGSQPFQPITLAKKSDANRNMGAPAGVDTCYNLLWDAAQDLGATQQQVILRATPIEDGIQIGQSRSSPVISVDGTPLQSPPSYTAPEAMGPVSIAAISGDNQTGISGQILPERLEARVRDPRGNPIAGARVTFNLPGANPEDKLLPDKELWTTTNRFGIAAIRVKFDPQSIGAGEVVAKVVGSPSATARWLFDVDPPQIVAENLPGNDLVYGQEYWIEIGYDGDGDLNTLDFQPDEEDPVTLKIEADNLQTSHSEVAYPIHASGTARMRIRIAPTILTGSAELRISNPDMPSVAPLVLQFIVDTSDNARRRQGGGPGASNTSLLMYMQPANSVHPKYVAYPGVTLANDFSVSITDSSAQPQNYDEEVTANHNTCIPPPVTRALPIRYQASGGTLATTQIAGTDSQLTVDAGTSIYFTPDGPGPWFIRVSTGPNIADPLSRSFFWINSSGGQECDRQGVIGGTLSFAYMIQTPTEIKLLKTGTSSTVEELKPGLRARLEIKGLSPIAGGAPAKIELQSQHYGGENLPDYTGIAYPVKQDISLALQPNNELHSAEILFVRGEPQLSAGAPVVHSAIGGGWIRAKNPALELLWPWVKTETSRQIYNDVESLHEAAVGTSPKGGAEDSVFLHNGEFVMHRIDDSYRTRAEPIISCRSYRSHLRYEGVLGPGWAFGQNIFLDTARKTGIRKFAANGRFDDFIEDRTPKGNFEELTTRSALSATESAYELRDPQRNTLHFYHDGSLRMHRDANGNSTQYIQNERGLLVEIRDPNQRSIMLEYYTENDPVEPEVIDKLKLIRDFSGREFSFDYYGANDPNGGPGFLKTVTPPAVHTLVGSNPVPNYERKETYTYYVNPSDRLDNFLLKVIDSENKQRLENRFSSAGWVTEQDFGENPNTNQPLTYTIVNDAANNLTTEFDRSGQETLWDFSNPSPWPDAATPTGGASLANPNNPNPEAQWIYLYRHNHHGHLVHQAVSSPNPEEYFYVYDDQSANEERHGNLLAVRQRGTNGKEKIQTFEYTRRHNQIQRMVPPKGNEADVNPEQYATYLIYDTQLSSSDPDAGDSGNLVRLQHPRSVSAVIVPTSSGGRRHLWIDENPTERFSFNSFGQMVRKSDVQGVTTEFRYFSDQDPTGVQGSSPAIGGGGLLAEVETDISPGVGPALNNRNLHLPGIAFTPRLRKSTYNVLGDLLSVTDARGVRTEFIVDRLHQITEMKKAASAAGPLTGLSIVKEFQYNQDGNIALTETRQPSANAIAGGSSLQEIWNYNSVGMLVSHAATLHSGQMIVENFIRDASDRLVGLEPVDVTSGRHTGAGISIDVDKSGAPVNITHSSTTTPHTSSFSWTPQGTPAYIDSPDGNREDYRLDEFQQVESIIDPGANVHRVVRDSDGNISRSAMLHGDGNNPGRQSNPPGAPLGELFEQKVDELGRPGRSHRIVHLPTKLNTTSTSGPNVSMQTLATGTDYIEDDNQWPQRVALYEEGSWHQGDGRQTNDVSYDAWGLPTRQVDDEVGFNYVRRNSQGLPIEERDAGGDETVVREYDQVGNLLEETAELKDSARFFPTGTQIGIRSKQEFDALGRVVRKLDGRANATRRTFDETGFVTHLYDAMGTDSTESYNNLLINEPGNLTEYQRDGLGRTRKITALLTQNGLGGGVPEIHSYNSAGTSELLMEYDEAGRLLSYTDNAGNTTSWQYESDSGRPRSVTYQAAYSIVMDYDSQGRIDRVTDANNTRLKYTYDNAVSRLQEIRAEVKGPNVEGTDGFFYSYDANETIVRDLSSNHQITRFYDSERQLRQEISGADTLDFTYTGQGHRASVTYLGNSTVHHFDKAGRLMDVVDNGQTIMRQEHLGNDHQLKRLFRNHSLTNGFYDGTGWLQSRRFDGIGGGDIEFNLERDRLGRITRRERVDGNGQIDTKEWRYDSLGRIIHETVQRAGMATQTMNREFDADSVIREVTWRDTGGVRRDFNQRYDRGRITMQNGQSMTYDPNGNLTDDGSMQYIYDAWNRLLRAEQNGQALVSYEYDAEHRKIARIEAGIREEYVYEGWRLLAVKVNGQITERYVYADQMDDLLFFEKGGIRYYPLISPEGSTDALVDDQGQLIERYDYDLQGRVSVLDASGNPSTNIPIARHLFQRRIFDFTTGLYDYRTRWYHPQLGQFITPDPSGLKGGLNHYGLCHGDPINHCDSYGLSDGWSWGMVLGIGAAVVVGIAITVVTGGAAAAVLGPALGAIATGIVAGAVAGAVGEAVEAYVDDRESHILRSAAMGALFGGIFSVGGVAVGAALRSTAGRAFVSRVLASPTGERVSQAVYRGAERLAGNGQPLFTSSGGRVVEQVTRKVIQSSVAASKRVGERLTVGAENFAHRYGSSLAARGRERIGNALIGNSLKSEMRRFVAAHAPVNYAMGRVSGWMGGEIDDAMTTLAARSGGGGSRMTQVGVGSQHMALPGKRNAQQLVQQEVEAGLRAFHVSPPPRPVADVISRAHDAEIVMFLQLISETSESSSGWLYIATSKMSCSSCFANMWHTMSARAGINIVNAAPRMVPLAGAAAGATETAVE
ncbi:MAG: hypothetical protein COB20_00590 [SAR86 cluster bacterium]|uniref:Teneurin-like YD-shell domain-containing protein n=1 Tax=SAR86 cluster bacterium TaxID=2030880 RepID=A0A2A4XHL5_9GAMM|nr:MAG: hypothetical protein COB20_00590 [SAR86 cluster bacterium]